LDPLATASPPDSPTLHVATVHWRTDRWIDVQRAYFRRNFGLPYRTYASLEGVDASHQSKFDQLIDTPGKHAEKLNALSEVMLEKAAPTDFLVFIDGDAFPIAPIGDWALDVLSHYPLVAIRRDENMGDPQPHPSFCITTAQFWAEIGGDWRKGHTWRNETGIDVTDVGGNLLYILSERNAEWLPLLRTNTVNLHQVMFGIYGGLIYHHGAGFRQAVTRSDWTWTKKLSLRTSQESAKSTLRGRALHRIANRAMRRRTSANRKLNDKIYRQILSNPEFFKDLL